MFKPPNGVSYTYLSACIYWRPWYIAVSNNNDTKRSHIKCYSTLKSTEISDPTFSAHLMSREGVVFCAVKNFNATMSLRSSCIFSNRTPKEPILRESSVRAKGASTEAPHLLSREWCEIYMLTFTIYYGRCERGPVVNWSTGRRKTYHAWRVRVWDFRISKT